MSDAPVRAADVKEMTKKEAEAHVSAAFKLERRIKEAAVKVHESWWVLSEALYEFHEAGFWSALGYGSLDEFLAQPDLGMSRSQFFQMTKLWRDLVVVKKLPPGDLKELEPSKVREVAPAIMKGEVLPEDALADAEELSYRDVKVKYRPEEQAKTGQKADGSTPLDAASEPKAVKCFNCGNYYTPQADDPINSTADEEE